MPVGNLFDVIAHGDEAFSQEMAIHFENAKRLYHQRLLPLLEAEHGMRREEIEALPYDDNLRTRFRADDRLVKTLLLAALVPGVESLRGLNANRLAALNHGTIKTPVPGKEEAKSCADAGSGPKRSARSRSAISWPTRRSPCILPGSIRRASSSRPG